MIRTMAAASILGASLMMAAPVLADNHASLTGEELRGHTVDVTFSDGTQNSIFFGSDGQALISGPGGASATANWYVQDDQLCMQASGSQECWGYAQPFAAGQTMSMDSGCDASSQWTARSVNMMSEPAMMGERG